MQRFRQTGNATDHPRAGRPRKTTPREDRFISRPWWRRLVTVRVLMWPPNAKLPRSAPAVLNGRCRAGLDMSRSSLGVVLRGLPARGWSVAFPI
jgi:hypothetical protein